MDRIDRLDKQMLYTDGIRNFFLRLKEEDTVRWIDDIYSSLPELISKWDIVSLLPNQIARYGLVIEASTKERGDIILKFTPGFINRFERESESYAILPKSYMCELIDTDYQRRCMILKKIPKVGYANFEDKAKLEAFYKCAVEDAVKYTGQDLKYIGPYKPELKKRCDDRAELVFCDKEIKEELAFAWDLYCETFDSEPLYILHGDLIDLNVLDDGERYYGVDPIGFLAPIELECARFIRNDTRNHPEEGYENRFSRLLDFFERFFDREKMLKMFVIDMAYCTYNSVFENDTPDETLVDLELIRIARQQLTS